MARHKPKKRRRNRDSAEKRLRIFLRENPARNGADLFGALMRAGINVSAQRVYQIERELGRYDRRRRRKKPAA